MTADAGLARPPDDDDPSADGTPNAAPGDDSASCATRSEREIEAVAEAAAGAPANTRSSSRRTSSRSSTSRWRSRPILEDVSFAARAAKPSSSSANREPGNRRYSSCCCGCSFPIGAGSHRRRGNHPPHLRRRAQGPAEDGDGLSGRGVVRLDDGLRERRVSAARAHRP